MECALIICHNSMWIVSITVASIVPRFPLESNLAAIYLNDFYCARQQKPKAKTFRIFECISKCNFDILYVPTEFALTLD